jgi:hypothetical protein
MSSHKSRTLIVKRKSSRVVGVPFDRSRDDNMKFRFASAQMLSPDWWSTTLALFWLASLYRTSRSLPISFLPLILPQDLLSESGVIKISPLRPSGSELETRLQGSRPFPIYKAVIVSCQVRVERPLHTPWI